MTATIITVISILGIYLDYKYVISQHKKPVKVNRKALQKLINERPKAI